MPLMASPRRASFFSWRLETGETEKLTNLLAWDGMGMLVGGDWSMNG